MQLVFECFRHDEEKTRTRKKNENDNKNEKPTDMPQDDDHAMQREMLPKPDNNIDTRSFELKPRREAHRNTRECVCEETAVDEVAQAVGHNCPTS